MAKFEMELDDNFVSKLFELTDACPPSSSELNLQSLKKQLYDLGVLIKEQNTNSIIFISPHLIRANGYEINSTLKK